MFSFSVSMIIAILVVIVISAIEFSADYLITKNKTFTYKLILGVLLYLLIGICWGALLFFRDKFNYNLSVINAVWQILSIVLIYVLSRYILKEKTNKIVITGLLICGAGITICGIGNYQLT